MIAEQIQPQSTGYAPTKYYQFSAILEHVIDCFHTIVTDETNPYHPPLAWLTRKQPKPPDEELFLDLHDECSKQCHNYALSTAGDNIALSSSVRVRLEKFPQHLRQEIVSRTRDGCAPLFLACKNGLTRVVKYLLDVCGADMEQRGRYEVLEDHHVHSVAPIWVAAVSGNLDTVKLLIDRGANVNSISDTGSTPLRSVCFLCKDDDAVEGYDNFQDDEYSFGGASEEPDNADIYMKIIRLLVENGADVNRPNYSGGTCLINSLHNYQLVKYIINRGVDVNAPDNQSKTALHYAVQHNRVAVVKFLLSNGADPFLKTSNSDDAFRLCCIAGHEEIFKYLISNYDYDAQRLSDAYKLLGSSILEIHYDLARVRKYWTESISIIEHGGVCSSAATRASTNDDSKTCDYRRRRAYRGMVEFCNESTMQSLTADGFRIQSLLISERILGSDHRETIQRLLCRGTFYINSLRPNRCLDLWIYALKLRLDHDSIFHFESIFAAQAITKLFLDLFGQRQQHQVRFSDVYDVLQLLIGRLDECGHHLSWRPRSCLHEDIYDLLLNIIVKLLLIMRCVRRHREEFRMAKDLTSELVKLNPVTINGSSLLHICVNPNMFEGDIHRSLLVALESASPQIPLTTDDLDISQSLVSGNDRPDSVINDEPSAPVLQLAESLIRAGLDVDLTNNDGLSAFQMLCLATSIRVEEKTKMIELLVRHGAHVDRRALTPEQDEQIRQALRECCIKPIGFVTLKCLAARRVSEMRMSFDKTMLASSLNETIAIH